DDACRAFTYNTGAQWCFLKSDYTEAKPFIGAVAGKIVLDQSGEPDLGAPPALSYVPDYIGDDARRYRQSLRAEVGISPESGIVFLSALAGDEMNAGNPQAAVERYRAALAIEPDDTGLW